MEKYKCKYIQQTKFSFEPRSWEYYCKINENDPLKYLAYQLIGIVTAMILFFSELLELVSRIKGFLNKWK